RSGQDTHSIQAKNCAECSVPGRVMKERCVAFGFPHGDARISAAAENQAAVGIESGNVQIILNALIKPHHTSCLAVHQRQAWLPCETEATEKMGSIRLKNNLRTGLFRAEPN